MSKGEETRQSILDEAIRVASVEGLDGLSIGDLASRQGLSKSGLFAHFGSKEALQIAVLEYGKERFVAYVVAPAIGQPRGLPRVRALFENHLRWSGGRVLPGGCPLMAAVMELDDKPGKLRDFLVDSQKLWLQTVRIAADKAIAEGHLRRDLDVDQFTFKFESILLGYSYAKRLLKDPDAESKAVAAFDDLIFLSQT